MKKKSVALLLLIMIGICACKNNSQEIESIEAATTIALTESETTVENTEESITQTTEDVVETPLIPIG